MAEPMSSNEIEDVLSSIRRLVAQDLKPSDRAKLAAVADTAQKLVLAPNQRIEDQAGGDARFVTVRRPSRRAAFPPVDAVLADVSVQTGGPQDMQANDQDFILGQQAALRSAAENAPPDYAQMALNMPDDPAPLAAEAYWQGDFVAPLASTEVEPDLGDEFTIDPNARLYDLAPPVWPSAQDTSNAAPEFEPDELDANPPADDTSESLSGTIEPDPQWADDAEARVIAELAGEAVVHEGFDRAQNTFREPNFTPPPPLAGAAQADVLFDESQLRAMVQAILREEMAGPMGERMTRNIRKLVRAEVGRMLAAHDLE